MKYRDPAMSEPYPCTIIKARYGGHYEGGAWLAFNCFYEQIPHEAIGDDLSCATFWDMQSQGMLNYPLPQPPPLGWDPILIVVGKGDTPNGALASLTTQLATEAVDAGGNDG